MKKLLSIVCLVLIVGALSSCTKKYITEVAPAQTYFMTVPASAWVRTTDGKADSVSLKSAQINSYFNTYGATLVYISYYKGVYEQIPEVYDNTAYSYIHYPGNLVLYSQPPGGGTPVQPANDILVKLVLLQSN